MSRESGQDRSQKTVAELLALHGGNVDGSRRRRRRAADDDDEQDVIGVAPSTGRHGSGTDPQTLIDRARAEAANSPSGRREGGRRALPDQDAPPFPRPQPTDSGPQPRVTAPEPAASPRPAPVEPFARPPQDSGGFPRPNLASNPTPTSPPPTEFPRAPQEPGPRPPRSQPPQESGAFKWPQDSGGYPRPNVAPPPDSGAYPRPATSPPPDSGGFPRPNAASPPDSGAYPRPAGGPPQDPRGAARPAPAPESGSYARPATPPQESGAFLRPNNAHGQDSNAFPVPGGPLPSREPGVGRRVRPQEPPMRRPPPESAAMPLPEPPLPDELPRRGQDTRAQMPRHATPPPPQPGAGSSLSARLDGLDSPPVEAPDQSGLASGAFPPPDQSGLASGAFPAPPRRRRRAAPPPRNEPHTEQLRPIDTGESLFEPVADSPPAGLSTWTPGRLDPLATQDTQVGVTPPVSPRQADLGDQLEATGFHDPFSDDEDGEEFGAFDDAEVQQLEDYEYDEESEPLEQETDEGAESEGSPARQWLSMAVQLALGVVGGAGVWLGFNWLWVKLPAAALAAAVLVIAALVWIVRRIRRAEDLQTTVLAVLVGLVVTVSPAALLLLSR